MTAIGWLVLAVLAAVVAWLGLALVGAVRELGGLRERVDRLEASGAREPTRRAKVPVGAVAPTWRIATPNGELVTSSTFEGRRHLVLFADAECRACEDLVPEAIAAASAGSIPPLAVIGRGDAAGTPARWRASDLRVRVGIERGSEASSAFGVDVTPTVFLMDEGGSVVAKGQAATLEDVRDLIGGSEGVRIVAAGGA